MFSEEFRNDRVCSTLILDDYDWMTYMLKTMLRSKKSGKLFLEFSYMGIVESEMIVMQEIGTCKNKYIYTFSSDIFEKYIIGYMKKHIQCWQNGNVFNAEYEVLEFYNEVIEKGKLVQNECCSEETIW